MRLLLLFLLLVAPLFGQTSQDYATYIRSHEGYTPHPYRDGSGWAVGVGHSLRGQPVKARYSAEEISVFLWRDIALAVGACRRHIVGFETFPVALKLALADLAFSVGPTGLYRFKHLRAALAARAFVTASIDLRESKWATQVAPARYEAARAAILSAQFTPR